MLLPFICPKTFLSWRRCGVYANELVLRIEFYDFYVQANFEETILNTTNSAIELCNDIK